MIFFFFFEFVGQALARFERSPFPEHKGTRTIVLRFLKITTPVECVSPSYDGHIMPCPEEGELFHRRISTKSDNLVWSVNIDRYDIGEVTQGFQLLWDATT